MDLTKAKFWFVALSMVALILFGISVQQESDKDWPKYQKEFFQMEHERGVDRDYSVKIRQIWLPNFGGGRTDRCITCHVGMEDTDVTNPYTKNPFKSHPNVAMLKLHPIEKMGCTVCHEGQGLATTVEGAHGRIHAWDYPMHERIGGIDMVQSSCTKCHAYDALPEGTELLVAGRMLVKKYGCMGCHQSKEIQSVDPTRGGPDWSGIGSKTESEFSNTHIFAEVHDRLKNGEFTTKFEWLFQHFLDPQQVTPIDPNAPAGTLVMPNFHMNETDARVLTTFIMSLRDPVVENMPASLISKSKGKYSVIIKE